MDWRNVGFDWNRARSFLATAEEGSFSAASRVLGIAQPTVGRQVAALEEELGVVLFARVGNSLELTEAGLELADHVRSMFEAATRVSRVAAGRSTALEGLVRVTASELIAAYLLPPVVARLRAEHPGIALEIVAANDVRDLLRREADIAVRNVAPTQPSLIAKNLGGRVARPYATPGYLATVGDPTTVAELDGAAFFAFAEESQMIDGMRALGVELRDPRFPVTTANHLVQWQMCLAGLGICFVMEEVGDAEPRVRRVADDFPELPVGMWLTAHREVQTSRRVRVVYDALSDALRRPQP